MTNYTDRQTIDGFNGNNINVTARVCGPNLTSGRHPNRINNS